MERLAIHSLIKLQDYTLLNSPEPRPDWVQEMLQLSPYVIVRRGEQTDNIPVGIRGFLKNQRFAATINANNIARVISPAQALSLREQLKPERQQLPPFQTLAQLKQLLAGFTWGIGGSLAYELVTGIQMVHTTSDLDIIMPLPTPKLSTATAQELLSRLREVATVHVDIQIVSGQYGFSLEEYANQRSTDILVKTDHGPILVTDPWQLLTKDVES